MEKKGFRFVFVILMGIVAACKFEAKDDVPVIGPEDAGSYVGWAPPDQIQVFPGTGGCVSPTGSQATVGVGGSIFGTGGTVAVAGGSSNSGLGGALNPVFPSFMGGSSNVGGSTRFGGSSVGGSNVGGGGSGGAAGYAGGQVCNPNQTSTCTTCTNGQQGWRACAPDGLSYSTCNCPSTGTGGSSGAGGAGGSGGSGGSSGSAGSGGNGGTAVTVTCTMTIAAVSGHEWDSFLFQYYKNGNWQTDATCTGDARNRTCSFTTQERTVRFDINGGGAGWSPRLENEACVTNASSVQISCSDGTSGSPKTFLNAQKNGCDFVVEFGSGSSSSSSTDVLHLEIPNTHANDDQFVFDPQLSTSLPASCFSSNVVNRETGSTVGGTVCEVRVDSTIEHMAYAKIGGMYATGYNADRNCQRFESIFAYYGTQWYAAYSSTTSGFSRVITAVYVSAGQYAISNPPSSTCWLRFPAR